MELSPLTAYHSLRCCCVVTLQGGNLTGESVETRSLDWRNFFNILPVTEYTMGSVADKIAKKVTSSRWPKFVDMEGYRKGRKMALEAGSIDDVLVLDDLDDLADLDPCHAVYRFALNVCAPMSESISGMREAKSGAEIIINARIKYRPIGPPLSPLTLSYFAMWAMFDVRFGSSRETMGNCILRIMPDFHCPTWLIDIVERMQQSRMGFFVHCGSDGENILLREVGTRETLPCRVAYGYDGSKGQVWFVRVLPPPSPEYRYHLVFNTPYVFLDYPESAFVDYLERELARMMAVKNPPLRTDDPHGHLMKYGPEPNHWNEYIFCAGASDEEGVIFLTGVPGIRESLPHDHG